MKFEDLLSDYNLEATDLSQFLANALLAALLTWLVSEFYKRYGRTVSNRSQFASNFMMLALATMLIIYIVKSSVALSLGLVGALSIVRFRAAIKEPEELTYLFLVIGIGLGMGANQPAITIIAVLLILALLLIHQKIRKVSPNDLSNQMVVNISSQNLDEGIVNNIMVKNFKIVELRRMSRDKQKLFMTYVIEAKDFEQLQATKAAIIEADVNAEFSLIAALVAAIIEADVNAEFSFIDNKNMIS